MIHTKYITCSTLTSFLYRVQRPTPGLSRPAARLLASTQIYITVAVRPIDITVRNQSLAVSGKSFAWRVLGMLPALKKKPAVAQSNACRAQRRLRLHHACMKHVVDFVKRFCSADTHVLCADGKVISPDSEQSRESADTYQHECTLLCDRNINVACERAARPVFHTRPAM